MTKLSAISVLSLAIVFAACDARRGAESAAAGAAAGERVVAYIGEEKITLAELEEAARPELAKLEVERYDKLRETLERIAIERMVEKEAAARGMTAEELTRAEVLDKVVEPTEEEIQWYYERNKPRIGDRSLEDMRELIVKTMKNNELSSYRDQFIRSLKSRAGFRLDFDPPRAEITGLPDDPVRGAEDAPVTIVEFADFECTYSKRAHPIMERLLTEYGGRVRFVFRDYPLRMHRRAMPAATAARCAAEQGNYWDYYQHLMMMQGDLGDEDLEKRAASIGLDVEEFGSCYRSKRHDDAIQTSIDSGRNLGVDATPTFFINGRRVIGAKTYEELKSVIVEELSRAEPTPEEVDG
jgi:protein-disulfide isomerase